MYIVYDSEEGQAELADTFEEAERLAEEIIEGYRGEAWPDGFQVIIARVVMRSSECDRKQVTCTECEQIKSECKCEEFSPAHEWDYTCDYRMEEVDDDGQGAGSGSS